MPFDYFDPDDPEHGLIPVDTNKRPPKAPTNQKERLPREVRWPRLTEDLICAWAEAYAEREGCWPSCTAGHIPECPGTTWAQVNVSLTQGRRGLSPGSSLRELLAARYGAYSVHLRPRLKEELILEWADAHFAKAGSWPQVLSGPIRESPGDTWNVIHSALRKGERGLAGGSSLAKLLYVNRGPKSEWDVQRQLAGRNDLRPYIHYRARPLTEEIILLWADEHHAATGLWPSTETGAVAGVHSEDWKLIDGALRIGARGLQKCAGLADLLKRRRGVRNRMKLSPLTLRTILAWADAHYRQTGEWPTSNSGSILQAPEETWNGINHALMRGARGLAPGLSLAKVLASERGVRNIQDLPRLTEPQILAWADEFRVRTGRWPSANNTPAPGTAGETWRKIDKDLRYGLRGLPGASSLSQLLRSKRGVFRGKDGSSPR